MSEGAEHQEKKARQKEAFEKRKAQATRTKGLLIVHTGAGKGKTTAALGLAFRAVGQGLKVGIVQFIKGAIATGEAALAQKLGIDMHIMGEGFTWNTQDRTRDVASARKAWEAAVALLRSNDYNVVILDELNVVIAYDYLPLDEVLQELGARRADMHVVITGRNARPELIERADLVTEMKLVKHPYREQGIKPQPGIEF
jgi:cob(I)alamin adenosyltransferase